MIAETINPYVGLRPFTTDESILFFGRNGQILELLSRLHKFHFVAVVGSSGSGKSSLLRAGVIPFLKRGYLIGAADQWSIIIMKPGQNPLYNLAESILLNFIPEVATEAVFEFYEQIQKVGTEAIYQRCIALKGDNATNFFLLVDQFEDLFRLSVNSTSALEKDEAIDFVNIILSLAEEKSLSFYVTITLRSDFIGDCAQFFGLPDAMNKSQYLVPRINRIDLRTIIEGPAKLYGSSISPVLVSTLLNDLTKVKDELPLLQHVLMQVWEYKINQNGGQIIEFEDYHEVGEIERALSDHADSALAGMSDTDIYVTKGMFQALTAVDENGRKIRRPVSLNELQTFLKVERADIIKIINLFAERKRAFLSINKSQKDDDLIIDISHESLIRQWGTLNRWVEEEAESASIYRDITSAWKFYDRTESKPMDLLSGTRLHVASNWYREVHPSVEWARRYNNNYKESIDYLKKSEANNGRDDNKHLGWILIVTFCLLAIIGAMFLFQKQAKTAETNYGFLLLHEKIHKIAVEDPTVALRLEEEVLSKIDSPQISQRLREIFAAKEFYKTVANMPMEILSLAVSPNGKFIGVAGQKNTAYLIRVSDNSIIALYGHKKNIRTIAFSPDNNLIITTSADGTACLFDAQGSLLKRFTHLSSVPYCATFTSDSKSILMGHENGILSKWSIAEHSLGEIKICDSVINQVIVSKYGDSMLVTAFDDKVRMYNSVGKLLSVLSGFTRHINSVSFSPDANSILTGSGDGKAILWDTRANMKGRYQFLYGEVVSVSFSPYGSSFCAASSSGMMVVCDLKGNTLHELKAFNNIAGDVKFTIDGRAVISGSNDGSVKQWNLNGTLLKEFSISNDSLAISKLSMGEKKIVKSKTNIEQLISNDGRYMLSVETDGILTLTNVKGSNSIFEVQVGEGINSVAFSPNSKLMLVGTSSGKIGLYDLYTHLIRIFDTHTNRIRSINFSKDGQSFLSISDDETIKMWATAQTLEDFLKEGKADSLSAQQRNHYFSSNRQD